jgi:PAS domain S-box-containing protein
VYDVQLAVSHANGSRVFLSENAAPLLDASGSLVGVVVSFVDITERKKSEDLKLRKLLLAVEQSPSAIVITDLDGNVEYANNRYGSMTGCTVKEAACGRMPHDCRIPERELKEMRSAARSGKAWRGEFECLRKGGEPYWESTSVTPIQSEEGEITNLLWVREDITERRLADQALREAREKFQNLVETISDQVWEVDPKGKYTYISPKVRDLLGYEPEELMGRTPFDLMPPAESRRAVELFRTIASEHAPFHGLENIFLHKTGRAVVIESSGAPFFDTGGDFRGYLGVDRDVGERKRAQEMLKVSEERFRQLFEQNEEPQFLFRGGTCEILDVNTAAERVYGFSREELLKEGVSLFIPQEGAREFDATIGGIRPGSGVGVDRTTHVRKDGTPIIVSIRGKSICTESELMVYCSFRDITTRIRMEEEAKLHQAQLIHANRMSSLGTIVSSVAHEVNNPNNLVMFNAPLILSAWDDAVPVLDAFFRENGDFSLGGLSYSEMREVVPRLAAGISDASARIKAIVENLKDFARQDIPNRQAPVQLNDAVRMAVAILNHEILRATHRFEVAYGEDLPPVMGSIHRLEQVVINLLNNALQSLPSNRHGVLVTTRLAPDTGEVELCVEDEGVGMPPPVLERIREPFFSTRFDSGGLGLGVSICRSIVLEHKGTLEFESEVGKGTRAIVRLPGIGNSVGIDAEGSASKIPTGV